MDIQVDQTNQNSHEYSAWWIWFKPYPIWRVSSLFLVARLLDQMDFAFCTKNGKLWGLLKHDPRVVPKFVPVWSPSHIVSHPIKSCYPKMTPKRHGDTWVFPKIGIPQNGWFIKQKPIKNGWFGGTIIFGNIHIELPTLIIWFKMLLFCFVWLEQPQNMDLQQCHRHWGTRQSTVLTTGERLRCLHLRWSRSCRIGRHWGKLSNLQR